MTSPHVSQALKRKRAPATAASTGTTLPHPPTREEEFAQYQRDGFLLLRKVVRKAVKNSRYLNGTGIYGVYVRDVLVFGRHGVCVCDFPVTDTCGCAAPTAPPQDVLRVERSPKNRGHLQVDEGRD